MSGQKAAVAANIEALRVLKELQETEAVATPEQQEILAQYVGWGGLADAVDTQKARAVNYPYKSSGQEAWEKTWLPYHKEIVSLLSEDELRSARESILNAHFTAREVIQGVWDLVEHLGVRGGSILEPSAGVGSFFGLMPEGIAQQSRLTGVELDSTTAKILGHLYPEGRMIHSGFESAKIPNNSVDLVVGNFPFGDYQVIDKENPEAAKHSIHNYFFLKSLDKLRPGGLIAAITTAYSMDAQGTAFRKAMAERADFVGGIRLPNTAFKSNAGTEVVADVLVFRKKNEDPFTGEPFLGTETVEVGENRYGQKVEASINQYFLDHPEMVLGEMTVGKMYGAEGMTVEPFEGLFQAQFQEAVQAFPRDIANRSRVMEQDREEHLLSDEKEGLFVLEGGKPYQVQGGELRKPEFLEDAKPGREEAFVRKLEQFIPLRETVKLLIAEQLRVDGDEARMEELRQELNRLYDVFTEGGKHPLTAKGAHPDLSWDVEWPLVQALEIQKAVEGPDGLPKKVFTKAEIFERRTIFPRTEPTEAQSLEEAISISVAFRGKVDDRYVADLVGSKPEVVRKEMVTQHLAFINPKTGIMEPAEEYLSGLVRQKLAEAEAALESNPEYEANVEALRAVQPLPIPIQSITVKLGAGGWLPDEALKHFAYEVLGLNMRFKYSKAAKGWQMSGYATNHQKSLLYGTTRKDAQELLEDSINMRRTVVKDRTDDDKYVVNQSATIQAQAAQEKIEAAFMDFVKKNEAIGQLVEKAYNETFNSVVKPVFKVPDFKHFPGANHEIILEAYQKRAVARALRQSTMFSHVVGSGKTFSLITTAMEMRRLGIARKPLIVVQGSTLNQFVASFRRLYPDANILAPNEKQRDASNRNRLMSQIATGDYDAVVIPHSFFDMIPDDPERVKWFVATETAALEEAIREMGYGADRAITSRIKSQIKFYQEMGEKAEDFLKSYDDLETAGDGRKPKSKEAKKQKQAIKAAVKLKNRLLRKMDRHVDKILTFEQLGVDALLVDEAHRYKRRDFVTFIDRSVKGVDKGSSKRSMGLLMKSDYVREKNNNRNVVLATGTPITNTIAEIWTMMGYLRPDILEAYNVTSFDEFVGAFAQISTELEMTYSGQFKAVSRLRKFVNGPELLNMWGMTADNVRSEDITRQALPRVAGGKMQVVDIEPTETVAESIAHWRGILIEWQNSSNKREMPHIPILVMGRSRQISVDPRLVDPDLPDMEGSKLSVCADKMAEIYKRGMAEKQTQLAFADLYQSPMAGVNGKRFNVYEDLKAKLVARGVPAKEIEIVPSGSKKNDEALATLFARVQAGEVRILLGATQTLGVGVNVQDRLKAVHHLDLPLIPADLEQRNGRIVRAGNMNSEVEIYSYGVRRTLDASLAQIIMNKAKFIAQIMEGSFSEREFDDPSGAVALSAAEMLASYADDPLVFRKVQVEVEAQRLRQAKAAFEDERRNLRMKINYQEDVVLHTARDLRRQRALAAKVEELEALLPGAEEAFKTYTIAPIIEDMDKRIRALNPGKVDTSQTIVRNAEVLKLGEFAFTPKIEAHLRSFIHPDTKKLVVEPRSIEVTWSVDGIPAEIFSGRFNSGLGTMLEKSIESAIKKAKDQVPVKEINLDRAQKNLVTFKEQIEAPFERQSELDELNQELENLNRMLEERGMTEAKTHAAEGAEVDLDALEAEIDMDAASVA